jgi:3-deoxy-D-manno-octulosonate 8-phosphate phosphatase (KDO 8-P phosphatase)
MTDLGALEDRLKRCRLLFLDFDGVLTDNRVIVSETGLESVICDRSDGLGIRLLRELTDVRIVIVSSEENGVVGARARKLEVECIQNRSNKLEVIRAELARLGVPAGDACYVGNDLNDIECLDYVGVAIGVPNAASAILPHLDCVTSRAGGHGAVREVCDSILRAKNVPTERPQGRKRDCRTGTGESG